MKERAGFDLPNWAIESSWVPTFCGMSRVKPVVIQPRHNRRNRLVALGAERPDGYDD